MIFKNSGHFFSTNPLSHAHKFQVRITVDGLPYAGNVEIYGGAIGVFMFGGSTDDGLFSANALPVMYADRLFSVIVTKDGQPFASQPFPLDNVVVHDVVISTSGSGGAPTGEPATITGKVERVLDNQAEAVARQLVAVEHKPDGSWSVTGDTLSDSETGSYILEVLTEGGDTFVLAMDEYGQPFTATAAVVQGDLIHPTVPNGYVYQVETGGILPATEPAWWVDTGANHTRTIEEGVTLRAIPFYRPLAHGPIKAELLP